MTNANDDLGKKIEQLVAEHIAATRRTVKEAIERGFASAGAVPVAATRAPKSELKERVRSSGERKRRGMAALAELGECFYRAVCAKPGESMTVLAADVGASARELHRAVVLLKQAGRVRAVGERTKTRYFPLASGAAAA